MKNNKIILVRENSIDFFLYREDKDGIPSKSMKVFYNKKMEINRDVTNLALLAYSELFASDKIIIVDAMAATGIGPIRMLKECRSIDKIYINDINPDAVDLIRQNLKLNNLDYTSLQIIVTRYDSNYLLAELAQKTFFVNNFQRPHVISIDPFGTPNKYINAACNAIKKQNGLLCITATDTAVLHGVRQKACERKYMSRSLKTEYHKELGARILLYFVARIANINNLGVLPLFSFSSRHFVRLFLLTYKEKKKIAENFRNFGFILNCHCGYRSVYNNNIIDLPYKCPKCDSSKRVKYSGPLWTGRLHNLKFLKKLLEFNQMKDYRNQRSIEKVINLAIEENNMPATYYNLHKLSSNLKLKYLPKIDEVVQSLRNSGYKASRTHFDYTSIKTNLDLDSLKTFVKNL